MFSGVLGSIRRGRVRDSHPPWSIAGKAAGGTQPRTKRIARAGPVHRDVRDGVVGALGTDAWCR